MWGNAPSIRPPNFLDSLKSPDSAIILDLGAGDGKCFRGMESIDPNSTLLAVDFSEAALQLCSKQMERVCADAVSLPFCDQVIDYIYAHHVLGHIPGKERELAVSEILRIAKPGALIWVVVFERGDFRAKKGQGCGEEYTYIRGNGIMTHYFTKEELMQLFSSCTLISMKLHQWSMQIKGTSYPRSMIEGLFLCENK